MTWNLIHTARRMRRQFSCLSRSKPSSFPFSFEHYVVRMPDHHKLICSAIDDIPADLDFGVSLGDSFTSVASVDESELPDSQEMATSAPASQDPMGPPTKKPRMTANRLQQQKIDRLKNKLKQRDDQLMLLLKLQTPSNASTGNESEGLREMKQEIDRLREQNE
jgi:hypothetical protein